MSENVNFYQGSKENYNPSEMQGGIYFSKDSKEILLNGESYGNATPADEEDITAESGNLKLKDRSYDEASFSGKGYVILRKNISEGKNILTQDMISEPNTRYIIQYDYDLNGGEIIIPEGCVLNFTGGSVSNGTINGNGTSINYCTYNIFNDTLIKNFNIEYFDIRWFGATEGEDCSDAFDRVIRCYNLAITTPIRVIGNYRLNRQIDCVNGIVIYNPTNSGYNPAEKYIPLGSKMKYVGHIDVAPNIIAFYTEHSDVPSTAVAKEAMFSIIGMSFSCENALAEQEDSRNYTSILIKYGAGGRPSNGFVIQNCSFSGFDKVFYFVGGDAPSGSMASGFHLINNDFRYNNYAIYSNTENTNITDMSFNFLKMERCKLGYGSKLHLQGIYGSNCISQCTVESIDSPWYISFRVGHLRLEQLYLEHVTGDFVFESVSPSSDFGGILELGEFYSINSTYNVPTYNFIVNNLTITGGCSHFNSRSFVLDNCTIDQDLIYKSNYGNINTDNIKLVETSNKNKLGSICVRTGIYQAVNFSEKDNYFNNRIIKNYYESNIRKFISRKYDIPLVTLNYDILNMECYNTEGTSTLLSNTKNYLFVFYKRNGVYKVSFKSTDTVIDSINTPYTEGICVIKATFSETVNISTIQFEYVKSMSGDAQKYGYISFITLLEDYSNQSLIDCLLLVNARNYPQYGNTNQRPELQSTNIGYRYYDITLQKVIIWDGEYWVEEDGVLAGTKRRGTFLQKPTIDENFIYNGFSYFCTDKQTSEGSTNGIMIYYKGDNIWVDALGKIIDDNYPLSNWTLIE